MSYCNHHHFLGSDAVWHDVLKTLASKLTRTALWTVRVFVGQRSTHKTDELLSLIIPSF